jgi:hypothetical protein
MPAEAKKPPTSKIGAKTTIARTPAIALNPLNLRIALKKVSFFLPPDIVSRLPDKVWDNSEHD